MHLHTAGHGSQRFRQNWTLRPLRLEMSLMTFLCSMATVGVQVAGAGGALPQQLDAAALQFAHPGVVRALAPPVRELHRRSAEPLPQVVRLLGRRVGLVVVLVLFIFLVLFFLLILSHLHILLLLLSSLVLLLILLIRL